MIRIIKDYWAIILSVLSIVILFIFINWHIQSIRTLIAIHEGHYDGKGFIYWPISGAFTECMIVPIGAFLIFVTMFVLGSVSRSTVISFLVMIFLSIPAFLFMTFSAMGDPAIIPEQIATTQINATNYNLLHIHAVMSSNGDQYFLIKCPLLPIGCQVVYKSPAIDENAKLQRTTSSIGDSMELRIGNQTVYTSE